MGLEVWSKCFSDASKIVQLIIDCQKLVPVVIADNTVLMRETEVKSRQFQVAYETVISAEQR